MRFSPRTWSVEARVAAAAFGLTLIAAAVVMRSGLAARSLGFLSSTVDTAVIMLMVPVTAIVLAMFYLALRLTWRGSVPEYRRHRRRVLRWTPDGRRA